MATPVNASPGNALHSAALAYAALGWPVFPLGPRRKTPLYGNPHPRDSLARTSCRGWLDCGQFGHGVLDATTDSGVIDVWWTRTPSAGIGMACGITAQGTIDGAAPGPARHAPDVLDIDVKKDAPGVLSRERLRQAGYLANCWAQVRTPSGGEHLYFDGTTQGNGSIRGAGVDFRSAGGYVVMPPTPVWVTDPGPCPCRAQSPNGVDHPLCDGMPRGELVAYRWLALPNLAKDGEADWSAIRRFLAPPHLWPPREPGRPGDTTVRGLVDWLAGQHEGNRNAALHWAVCKALESDHHADVDALATAARSIGLAESEISKTVGSARRKAILTTMNGGR